MRLTEVSNFSETTFKELKAGDLFRWSRDEDDSIYMKVFEASYICDYVVLDLSTGEIDATVRTQGTFPVIPFDGELRYWRKKNEDN